MSKSPNRLLGVIFGAVYVLIGVLGFTVTSGTGFFATSGGLLLGIFEVNVFHNVAHILIGAALLLAGISRVSAAKTVNSVVGFAYLVLGLAGLFLVGTAFNILAINAADNVLHFASAALLLAVGLGADRRGSVATA
ncbi:MAG: hypothetical protein BGO97_06690 [Micrococcales bacterium 70-64]|nr:DUF4383 domain-containing protein [Leifsonia sp.]ODU63749.1 MAG: hypothetical protein ABT06_06695 [Leifsonia sp. SCN 70-46]OJX85440.1 MAG: hypothetical protein BGO97_06690 [Micrococcales bacterium 70-64]